MTPKSVLIGLTMLLLAAFVSLNWESITTPGTVSLGFMPVQAPLGLILLAFCVLLCALFLAYIVLLQAKVILDARRVAKDLQQQRELADKAEASRFTQMGVQMEAQIQQATAQQLAAVTQLSAQVGRLEQALGQALNEATGSLSACIGEVEDKLDRVLPPAAGQ